MAHLRDIAAQAGVSICTVSKILNRAPGWEAYSAACVTRVQRVAARLGYRRNYLAAALQTGRTDALGMLVPHLGARDMHDGFITSLISGVEIAARAAGCHFVMIGPGPDGDIISTSLAFLEEGRVDGLIVPAFATRGAHLATLERSTKPIVIIGDAARTSVPAVTVDHAAGITRAVQHLYKLGHRHIWWCGTDVDFDVERLRYKAFRAAARRLGILTECVRVSLPADRLIEQVIAAAQAAIVARCARAVRATAAVCYNEAIAFGVYAGLRDSGRAVPRDMSVIGFDDIYACIATPPMTVVSHMLDVMAVQAVRMLLRMRVSTAAWQRLRGQRTVITPALIVRGSTARVARPRSPIAATA